MDAGAAAAAARLVQLDPALVVAGLSASNTVTDLAVCSPVVEPGGADPVSPAGHEHGLHAEIGGYLVVARRSDAWEAIADLLRSLEEHHADAFHRLMQACRTLSNSGWERDGLDDLLSDRNQLRFDLALSRERRRDRSGFVSPERARAFLEAARHVSLAEEPQRAGWFEPQSNQALQLSTDSADAEWVERELEFAFIANALVAGCSILGRSFERQEASDAVTATCNLGIAHWPVRWAPAPAHTLTTVFQVGWTVLHRDVSMAASARLLDILDATRPLDRDAPFEFQAFARELRRQHQAGTPWRARVSPEAGRRVYTVDPSKFQFTQRGGTLPPSTRFSSRLPSCSHDRLPNTWPVLAAKPYCFRSSPVKVMP